MAHRTPSSTAAIHIPVGGTEHARSSTSNGDRVPSSLPLQTAPCGPRSPHPPAPRFAGSFKKFIAYHSWQANERVRIEAQLLVDAFLNRGKMRFTDVPAKATVGPVGEASLGPGLIRFRDQPVPGPYLVREVRVMTRAGEGVVGVQLVMRAGESKTEELQAHGARPGEGRSTRTHRFRVEAPVERLSRFECEHDGGVIERMRAVTSGGRVSPWFGQRLTGSPHLVALPDWRNHSLAAGSPRASTDAGGAGEVDGPGVPTPGEAWDPQREYITGLMGARTDNRLVALGVITRHVTSSHVLSYLWELPGETAGAAADGKTSPRESTPQGASAEDGSLPSGPAAFAHVGGLSPCDPSCGPREGSVESSASSEEAPTRPDRKPSAGHSRGAGPPSPVPGVHQSASGIDGQGGSESESRGGAIAPVADETPSLCRAEAKRQRFVQGMRDKERRKEQRAREARERREKIERLMRGRDHRDDADEAVAVNAAGGSIVPPTPHEEFAAVLRMRLTDARVALERSTKLARAARTYRGDLDGQEGGSYGSALNSLPVVMGLSTWFYQALLPRLVPLPAPPGITSELLHRGETALISARAMKTRGGKLHQDARVLAAERLRRPRRGIISPAERAAEVREREVSKVQPARACETLRTRPRSAHGRGLRVRCLVGGKSLREGMPSQLTDVLGG